jgi:beta-lactamase regulating signal transducer with metallopeptidase domain
MNPSTEALAWALVHFIWQGAALALIAFFAMRWLRLPAEGRYVAGILTLAAMLASPVVTYVVLARSAAPAPIVSALTGAPSDLGAVRTVLSTDAVQPPDIQPGPAPRATLLLLAAWLCGVAVFSMRLAGGWIVARRMVTRGVRPVTPEIALLARRVAGRLALDRAVRLIESSAVSVPVMVGWLKPIVLLPAVAVSGLTPTQLEALIAHELAHVRRHDYLVNLLQAAVETLLFYHPAIWWVSKQVRAEREHCCDDLAVRVCDRLVYVSALSDLAAMAIPRTALAATGGSLLTRVKRILGGGDSAASTGAAWVPGLVALVVLGAVVPALGSSVLTQATVDSAVRTDNVAVIEETVATPPQVEARVAEVQAPTPPMAHLGWESMTPQAVSGADAKALRDLQVALEQLQKQASDVELKRYLEHLDVAQMRMKLDMQRQVEASKIQLDELMKQRARMRQLVERGLMSRDELGKVENKIQEVEQTMAQAREQMNLEVRELTRTQQELATHAAVNRLQQADLAKRYAEMQAQAEAQAGSRDARDQEANRIRLSELERQLREYRQIIEAYKVSLDRDTQELREERARNVRGRAEFGSPREGRLNAETVPVTNAAEPIRAGDVLSVEITGESDLPRAYLVQTDGTVRLPILGPIKVAGLTAQQAAQAITKQVSRVNSSASIQVSLRRPRTEERRQR